MGGGEFGERPTHEAVPSICRVRDSSDLCLTSVRPSVSERHLARSLLRLRSLGRIRSASADSSRQRAGKFVRAGMMASRHGAPWACHPGSNRSLGDVAG
jgi:hypothetical protein